MAGLDLGGGKVVLAGLAGALLHSDDSGRTFRSTPEEVRKGTVAMLGSAGHLVLFGEGGIRPVESKR